MALKLQRLGQLLVSVLYLMVVLLASSSAARLFKAGNVAAKPLYFNDPAPGMVSGPDECSIAESDECSPPMNNSFGASKRLVPTGPNPLHNSSWALASQNINSDESKHSSAHMSFECVLGLELTEKIILLATLLIRTIALSENGNRLVRNRTPSFDGDQ